MGSHEAAAGASAAIAPQSASAAPAGKIKLDLVSKLSYGFGSIAPGIKDAGFKSMLLIYWNQVVGLPADEVAFAIFIAIISETVLDPIIGHVSDNWRSRWGRRHPFMYASAVPASLAFLLLWFPPAGWSDEAMILYLATSAIIVRSCIAFYEIPSVAMVSELTQDYDTRTSLMSYRYYFFFTGGTILSLLTFRVFLQPDATHPVGQLNPNGYHTYALVGAAVMFVSIIVAGLGTHKYIPQLRQPPPKTKTSPLIALKHVFQTLWHRSFIFVTIATLCKSCTIGISGALNLFLSTYFWQLSASEIAILQLDTLVAALMAATLTRPISRRFGKRTVCMVFYVAAFIIGAAPLLARHFGVMWPNGSPYLLPTLFVQGTLFSFTGISSTILAQSMVADVVEDSERRTGRRSEGLFFSAGGLVSKATNGLGVFGAGLILASIHFPEKAKPGQIPTEMLDKLAMTYLPVAGLLYVIGLICLSQYRISRRTHNATVAALSGASNEGPMPAANS